eukprot:symbB.v1.2.024920.t1/scaffold2392.1/size80309/3
MGFGTLHDILEQSGEQPNHWIRNKSRWLLEILRATRTGGLKRLGERLDDALQVGVEADHSVFRYLLYEALKVPDLEYVTKWFEKAVRHGVVPETPIVNHIIGEVSKLEGLTAAEEWFEKATMAGVKPNVYTYKYLIQAASVEERDPETWFRRSLAAGIAPDVVTFNTLINAAAKKGKLSEAVDWFHMALSMSVRPDMLTYNMVLAAAAQAGDSLAAEQWFNKMTKDGFAPDIVSYNSLMKALMKTARTRDVEELFWKMKMNSVLPDVVTIKTMRWALGRQRVKELLEDADLLAEQWSDEQLAGPMCPKTVPTTPATLLLNGTPPGAHVSQQIATTASGSASNHGTGLACLVDFVEEESLGPSTFDVFLVLFFRGPETVGPVGDFLDMRYLDFLKEKRRQMAVLVVSALSCGVLFPLAVATVRGEPQETIAAVQIMALLFVVTVAGLGAYGATQGGSQREF